MPEEKKILERFWQYDAGRGRWTYAFTKAYMKQHPQGIRKTAQQPAAKKTK